MVYQRKLIASILLLTPALALAADEKKPAATQVSPAYQKLSAAKRLRLERKAVKMKLRRFDEPDKAVELFVNSRTGPIITRGAAVTSGISKPLDQAPYRTAINQLRNMPRFSSATKSVLPPDGGASIPAASPGAALGTWSPIGPTNQGGRTRALLIDPTSPNTMYAGGVDGGVWKSTDGGGNWTTTTDLQMSNLAVVSLAFLPGNPNTIFAGTGEGFFNIDAIRGAGIFKSTDAGVTWNQIASTADNPDFHYVNKISISPRNPQRMFVATRTGIFRSIDGGTTWTRLVNGAGVNGCTDVTMQQNRTVAYVFASCGNFGQGTIYRGFDSNAGTLTSVLSQPGQGRSTIAIAPSNENYVYILSARNNAGGPGANGLFGVFRSTVNGNPGSFTTQVAGNVDANTGPLQARINQLLLTNPVFGLLADCGFGGSNQFFNQGWYDNIIAVDPVDPNRVWAGGIDLWRSDDGGANWGTASFWWFEKDVDPQYSHADQHAIVFHPGYNGTTNRVMFAASDGGITRIDNARSPVSTTLGQICGSGPAGGPWIDRNNNYQTTQFYDGVAYPNGATYFGGLQDNGTMRGVTGNTNWSVLEGGDGGYVAVDTLNDGSSANDILFLENTGYSIQRSTDGGDTFVSALTGITGDPGNGGPLFITPFTMNLGTKSQLWTGGWSIYRTSNHATSWSRATTVSGTCGLGSVSAIAVHPLDGNRVMVGMTDGCVNYQTAALSTNNASTWPAVTLAANRYISWLAYDPVDVNIGYATVSAFGVANVYKTSNGGGTWTPIVGSGLTALPQVPARSIVVNPANTSQLFVGTDIGVFTSIDGGLNWYRENTGFANVSVFSLKISENVPYKLFAFTHGRGAFVTNLADNGILNPE